MKSRFLGFECFLSLLKYFLADFKDFLGFLSNYLHFPEIRRRKPSPFDTGLKTLRIGLFPHKAYFPLAARSCSERPYFQEFLVFKSVFLSFYFLSSTAVVNHRQLF